MAKKSRLYTFPNGQPSDGQKVQLEFDNIYEGANNVDAEQISAEAITTDKLANGAVTDTKIATGAVTDIKVSPTANIAQTKINSTTGWITTSLTTANDNSALAVSTATSAESKADTAVTIATSAESKADTAIATANSAVISAGDASTDANGALVAVNALTEDYSAKLPVIEAGIASIAEKVDKSYVDDLVSELIVGTIPDGTITVQKLTTSLANTINGNTNNIGNLTALITTEKTNLVGAINEHESDISSVNSQLAQIKQQIPKLFSDHSTKKGYTYITDFLPNGDITETIKNKITNDILATKSTVFLPNGDIQETIVWTDPAYTVTKLTKFLEDGSIENEVS